MRRYITLVAPMVLIMLLCACAKNSVSSLFMAPTPTPASTPTPLPPTTMPTPAPLNPQQIAERVGPSTVMIRATLPQTASADSRHVSGTGFVFAEGGYIVTNAHVVQGAERISLAMPGSRHEREARIVGVSPCDDLAVLQTPEADDLTPAVLGKSYRLKVGEKVVALGYPLGERIGTDLSVREGIVSKLDVTLGEYPNLIQTDAAINPGDSGGPLIDQRGEIIGINTWGTDTRLATGINFAISIDYARSIVTELQRGNNRQWTGMDLVKNTDTDLNGAQNGMVVDAVEPASPATQVGVRPGDLLVKLAGKSINSRAALCGILRSQADSARLKIEILRRTETERQRLAGTLALGGAGTKRDRLAIIARYPFTRTYDFTLDAGDWYTGTVEGLRAEIREGFYNVFLTAPKGSYVLPANWAGARTNAGIAAEVFLHGDLRAGVALRYQRNGDQSSYYACWIDSGNRYGCFVYANGTRTNLVGPAVSERILAGKTNVIAMGMLGDEVMFRINGVEIARLSDSRVASGSPGLYLENFDTEAGAIFDAVAIRELDISP